MQDASAICLLTILNVIVLTQYNTYHSGNSNYFHILDIFMPYVGGYFDLTSQTFTWNSNNQKINPGFWGLEEPDTTEVMNYAMYCIILSNQTASEGLTEAKCGLARAFICEADDHQNYCSSPNYGKTDLFFFDYWSLFKQNLCFDLTFLAVSTYIISVT